MKKFISMLLAISLLFVLAGCQTNAASSDELTPVSVNMPTDDTVNGYRIEISEDSSSNTDTALLYCGNISSKVFHKSTCSSVSRMKESNKLYGSDRKWFINENYTPCKSCNP